MNRNLTSSSFASRSLHKNQKLYSQPPSKPRERCVLIMRNVGGIGDMLMLTPTIRAIKEKYPDEKLVVCTSEKYGNNGVLFDILRNNPYIDQTIRVNDLDAFAPIKVYNLGTGIENSIEVNPKSPSQNRIDIFLKLAELDSFPKEKRKPVYVVTEKEKVWANKWIEDNIDPSKRFLIGIQYQSAFARRTWPAEKNILLALSITNMWLDSSVLLFFDRFIEIKDRGYPNLHFVVGMPIRQVIALVDTCNALVTPDSAFLHIAGAIDKPTVALFGPQPPESRLSYYPQAIGITLNYPCSPCWYKTCENELKCIADIPVDMVFDELARLVGKEIGSVTSGKTLIKRMGGIGDLIMMTPALRKLREENPEQEIIVATKPPNVSVLKGLPYLNDVITLEEADKLVGYSLLDLRYRVECPEVGGNLPRTIYTTENRIDTFARLFKLTLEDRKVDVRLDETKIEKVKKLLKYNKKYKYIGLQATCTSNLRTIPPEYLPDIVAYFAKPGQRIVLFGKTEFWHGRVTKIDIAGILGRSIINLMDKLDLEEMTALVSLMDFIIAPDSSSIHIAAGLEKPCLALFGNLDPELRIKYYPTVKALFPKGELACIPCHDFKNPCEHYKHLPIIRQPIGGECMRKLTPERIIKEVKVLFDSKEGEE